MTTEEIIEAKSKEITRLHGVCKYKNGLLWECLERMIELNKYTTNDLHEQNLLFIHNLKEYLNH